MDSSWWVQLKKKAPNPNSKHIVKSFYLLDQSNRFRFLNQKDLEIGLRREKFMKSLKFTCGELLVIVSLDLAIMIQTVHLFS